MCNPEAMRDRPVNSLADEKGQLFVHRWHPPDASLADTLQFAQWRFGYLDDEDQLQWAIQRHFADELAWERSVQDILEIMADMDRKHRDEEAKIAKFMNHYDSNFDCRSEQQLFWMETAIAINEAHDHLPVDVDYDDDESNHETYYS
jgi:hypothetical protein